MQKNENCAQSIATNQTLHEARDIDGYNPTLDAGHESRKTKKYTGVNQKPNKEGPIIMRRTVPAF